MKVTRRDFVKYCLYSAASIGLSNLVIGRMEKAMAGDLTMPTVVWLNGANCTGCTVSLANLISDQAPTDVADLLINHINLAYHPNLMGAAGSLAVNQLEEAVSGPFVLVVDGGIPTAFNGHTCMLWTESDGSGGLREVTALEAVNRLAPQAAHVLAVGTCASYGGVPGGSPNPTGIGSVQAVTGVSTINIPGCPTHPGWIAYTIGQLLVGVVPQLDSSGRPRTLFGGERCNVHENCPREEDDADEARTFGQYGCLKELGCKGPRTQADCPTRKWNNGSNWCIGANAVCLGCTEPGFPDGFSPFFRYADVVQNMNLGNGDSADGGTSDSVVPAGAGTGASGGGSQGGGCFISTLE